MSFVCGCKGVRMHDLIYDLHKENSIRREGKFQVALLFVTYSNIYVYLTTDKLWAPTSKYLVSYIHAFGLCSTWSDLWLGWVLSYLATDAGLRLIKQSGQQRGMLINYLNSQTLRLKHWESLVGCILEQYVICQAV